MRGKSVLVVVVLCISLLFSMNEIPHSDRGVSEIRIERNTRIAGVTHDPITIGSDAELITKASDELWLGDGSQNSPFVIENYDIDLGGASGDCIIIENTTLYFVIRDCYFTGATQPSGAGVQLGNMTHGEISNNVFFQNSQGISGNANYSIISGNFINSTPGSNCIEMTQTYHTQFLGNELISGNYGIRLSFSSFNEITNNIVGKQGGVGIYLSVSDNCTLTGNQCSGKTIAGINFWSCEYNVLEDNLCFDNEDGILLDTCTNIRVLSSTIRANRDGVVLRNSPDSLVMSCLFSDNTNLGLALEVIGARTVVSWNEFLNNTEHVQDAV
ncbi:MAG: NosD domain-containing protein, partial [Candidatus Thorarchaeota archaeon]